MYPALDAVLLPLPDASLVLSVGPGLCAYRFRVAAGVLLGVNQVRLLRACRCLRFRVSGFRVQGSGFRVQGSGFR
eukprot:2496281-Rhodomonas_salina.1